MLYVYCDTNIVEEQRKGRKDLKSQIYQKSHCKIQYGYWLKIAMFNTEHDPANKLVNHNFDRKHLHSHMAKYYFFYSYYHFFN